MNIGKVITTEPSPPNETRKAYEQVSRAVGELICFFHPETGGTHWMDDLGLHLGYPPGEMMPPLKMLGELVSEKDRADFPTHWNEFLNGEQTELEVRFRKTCGDSMWFRLHRAADPERIDWQIIRFQPAEDSVNRRDALGEAFRLEAIQTLAGGVAHEFNNHLTPVTGFIELAIESLGEQHEAVADLEIALKQVNACCDLIGHMQSFSGSGVVNPRSTDLGKTTASLVRHSMNLEPNSDGISLEESYEAGTPAVSIDHASFRKMVTQIVRNAIAAMERDGTIRVRTEVVPDAPIQQPNSLGYVRVSIEDNGCGMCPSTLRRIRDPFFTTKGRAVAKGLGLPMVHGMMRQHKGTMEVVSTPNRGTTVSLYFPIPEAAAPATNDDAMPVQAAAKVGRVLLADDEDVIRRLMVRVFQTEDWMVQEAHDFTEMLDIVEKDPSWFDLILMDFTMPGPTPEEAVARLHACKCTAKIMVVTGMAQDERLSGLLGACDGAYVPKPFSPRSLLRSVDEFMTE